MSNPPNPFESSVLLFNPRAGGGRALEKWKKIATPGGVGQHTIELYDGLDLGKALTRAFCSGVRLFVAGGGDGTVNLLLNALMTHLTPVQRQKILFGAIGLGSSNDFHKPLLTRGSLHGIPLALNVKKSVRRDVLKLELDSQNYYAFLNASCGITAQANHLFNNPNSFLFFLKKRIPSLAIFYACIHSIICHKNQLLRVRDGHTEREMRITNMGILKSPHFAGDLSYGFPLQPEDGRFHVRICENMDRKDKLHILWNLLRHRFPNDVKTHSLTFSGQNVFEVSSAHPFLVEYDGEVRRVLRLRACLMEGPFLCCTSGCSDG